jgi:hypothetical protein
MPTNRVVERAAAGEVFGVRTRTAIVIVVLLAGAAGWWMRVHGLAENSRLAATMPAAPEVRAVPPPVPVEVAPALPPETESERLNRLKRFGDIPREKINRIVPILRDYLDLEQKLRLENRGPNSDRALWQSLNLLHRERRADLEKILTLQEAEDCDMHWSQSGRSVIDSLGDIPVSDDERRALFRLQSGFDSEFGANGIVPVGRESARLATYDQMRALLGEERFSSFLARDDPGYQRFLEITEQQAQPSAIADQLWRMRSEYLIRREGVNAQASLDLATKVTLHTALDEEIRARVTALVGEMAVRERTTAFNWLPRPTRAAPSSSNAPR